MMRGGLAWLRCRAEGLLLLVFSPGWLLVAGICWLGGRRWGNPPARFRPSLRRWMGYLRHGLQSYREAWWVQWRYERKSDILGQLLLTEYFAALNLGRCGRPTAQLPTGARVLVIKLAHFGDALHIVPMLDALKAQRPDVTIDLLVGPWCRFLATKTQALASTIEYTPRYVLFNRGQTAGVLTWPREYQFLHALRRLRYDLVISTSTMNLPELLLIQAAGPTMWVGAQDTVGATYQEVPSRAEPYDSRRYEADRVCHLLELAGLSGAAHPLTYPLPADVRDWAELQKKAWLASGSRRLVTLSPGAGWPGKQWPAERFAQLIRHLCDERKAVTVLLGAPGERALTASVAAQAGAGVVDMGGRTTLDQLAALIEISDLFVGNDSGPLHVAAALHTPSLALFGPTMASKWAPRGPHHRLIQKEYACTGCWSWHPLTTCQHDGACMKKITVSEVCALADELLTDGAVSPNNR